MLALLHTAQAHVQTFARLAREIDETVPVRHEVQESLLSLARTSGVLSDAVRAAVASAVRELAESGARLIVCTCSTVGAIAESGGANAGVTVMRIDRPMAEQAVASGRRILVLAALRSTVAPTLSLLRQIAADTHRSPEVVEAVCEQAWQHFEAGNLKEYAVEIAKTIEDAARPTDVVLLAQASMAPAAALVRRPELMILSSPRLGMEAAISIYRRASSAPSR
jgi:hypothetical protein